MRNVIIAFLAWAMLASCSKYDENPLLVVYPKKARMTGVWVVQSYVDEEGAEWAVEPEQADLAILVLERSGEGTQGTAALTWYFSDDKKALVMVYDDEPAIFHKQEILKLTNAELWLGNTTDGYSKSKKQ